MFLRLCGGALGVGMAGPVDARCIEPYAVEVTWHDVFLPELPEALDGTTVAQLTDLHRGRCTPDRTIRRAVALTCALKPDLIVLTGDFVNRDPADIDPLVKMLAPLKARYGLWGCLGNHDYHDPDRIADTLAKAAGVRMLRNAGAEAAPGLWIAGVEDNMRGRPDAARALREVPDGAATLFLTHSPVGVWDVTDRSCLALSGHSHGGQVRIPGLPPRVPPDMEGFPLVAGWGLFDQARLYVSRGVGMSMLPLRFDCRPEVALFTLRRGAGLPRTTPAAGQKAVAKIERYVRSAAHRLAAQK